MADGRLLTSLPMTPMRCSQARSLAVNHQRALWRSLSGRGSIGLGSRQNRRAGGGHSPRNRVFCGMSKPKPIASWPDHIDATAPKRERVPGRVPATRPAIRCRWCQGRVKGALRARALTGVYTREMHVTLAGPRTLHGGCSHDAAAAPRPYATHDSCPDAPHARVPDGRRAATEAPAPVHAHPGLRADRRVRAALHRAREGLVPGRGARRQDRAGPGLGATRSSASRPVRARSGSPTSPPSSRRGRTPTPRSRPSRSGTGGRRTASSCAPTRPIKAIKDLEGKKLAISPGNSHQILWPVFEKLSGLKPNSVTWVTMDAASMPPALIKGATDAVPFSSWCTRRASGRSPSSRTRTSACSRRGRISDSISAPRRSVAREDTIAKDPEALKAFLRATLKGADYAFRDKHFEEGVGYVVKYHPEVDPDGALGAAQVGARFVYAEEVVSGKVAVGQFEPRAAREDARSLHAVPRAEAQGPARGDLYERPPARRRSSADDGERHVAADSWRSGARRQPGRARARRHPHRGRPASPRSGLRWQPPRTRAGSTPKDASCCPAWPMRIHTRRATSPAAGPATGRSRTS